MRQTALASGFADLISTQLASFELERQDELTARVELRALQSQVDPHFLFNTISTIVSLVRTEPDKARSLLIDFSNYYRQTLSDSDTLTTLEHEVEQGTRYINPVSYTHLACGHTEAHWLHWMHLVSSQ